MVTKYQKIDSKAFLWTKNHSFKMKGVYLIISQISTEISLKSSLHKVNCPYWTRITGLIYCIESNSSNLVNLLTYVNFAKALAGLRKATLHEFSIWWAFIILILNLINFITINHALTRKTTDLWDLLKNGLLSLHKSHVHHAINDKWLPILTLVSFITSKLAND